MSAMSETSDYSSIGSDQPLINSQDMSQLLSQENNMTVEEEEEVKPIRSQPKTCAIKQSDGKAVHTTDWKGSRVVNYKRFKKCSQSSQEYSQSQTIPLRRVDNQFYKSLSQNESQSQSNDNNETNGSDSELVIRLK